MKVELEVKSVYGKELIYPANEAAKKLAKLAGKKSFNLEDVELIKQLGFEVERVYPDSPF